MDLVRRGRPLVVWAVSDGRAGIEGQVVGLAQALARLTPVDLETKRIAWRGPLGRLPGWLKPSRALLTPDSGISPPWPDVWIAAGRATLPLSRRVRQWSGGRTFVVQTQDPRTPLDDYDLVIPPRHDQLEGPNVFPIVGSPHRVTAERMRMEADRFAARISALPPPRVAVLIGGASKAHRLSSDAAAELGRRIAEAVLAQGGSLLLTFSRRTPEDAKAALNDALARVPAWIWDGQGENPYFGFLGAADAILVTADSVNMAVEAAASGRPVHILPMEGGSPKFERFHASLQAAGAARPFDGVLESWSYTPLAETDRAAAEILRRLEARRA